MLRNNHALNELIDEINLIDEEYSWCYTETSNRWWYKLSMVLQNRDYKLYTLVRINNRTNDTEMIKLSREKPGCIQKAHRTLFSASMAMDYLLDKIDMLTNSKNAQPQLTLEEEYLQAMESEFCIVPEWINSEISAEECLRIKRFIEEKYLDVTEGLNKLKGSMFRMNPVDFGDFSLGSDAREYGTFGSVSFNGVVIVKFFWEHLNFEDKHVYHPEYLPVIEHLFKFILGYLDRFEKAKVKHQKIKLRKGVEKLSCTN